MVQAGYSAALMAMALKCPVWTALSLNNPKGTDRFTEPLYLHTEASQNIHIYWRLLLKMEKKLSTQGRIQPDQEFIHDESADLT